MRNVWRNTSAFSVQTRCHSSWNGTSALDTSLQKTTPNACVLAWLDLKPAITSRRRYLPAYVPPLINAHCNPVVQQTVSSTLPLHIALNFLSFSRNLFTLPRYAPKSNPFICKLVKSIWNPEMKQIAQMCTWMVSEGTEQTEPQTEGGGLILSTLILPSFGNEKFYMEHQSWSCWVPESGRNFKTRGI